jgi:nucleoside-diphosphate-sugar epimerase
MADSSNLDVVIGTGPLGLAVARELLAKGKAASVTGNPDTRHTYMFVGDLARGLVDLGEHDEAFGQTWHVPSAETVATREFVALVFEELGKPAKIRVTPRWLLSLLGIFDPVIHELPEILYQSEQPFVVDHSKYERVFAFAATSHREAISRTLNWYQQKTG